jgi:succinate-semialdehyde dehydrogenase/glutarate-semialdehyde dehydrogenase
MSDAKKITVVNPATGETVRTYDAHTPDEAATFVEAAHEAHRAWRRSAFSERAALLRRVAGLLRERADTYARLMALEMGKPVSGGRAEVEKCALVCEYYADNAEQHLAPRDISTDAQHSYVACQPLGVVLAVMPWNFPFWQVFRFIAPALMAGNAGVLKHASNVPGCALAIEEVLVDAGLPEGLFKTLLIGSSEVAAVIEHPRVVAVTLTGSTPAGKAVAATAGGALKTTVLELGGSDPYVILEDADLGAAAKACAKSRLINSGQSCIAAKRFIVVDVVHDAFVKALRAEMAAATMGDPTSEDTDVGPQARVDLRDELHDQVTRSVAAGAKVALGGEVPDGPGAFYPPTLLVDVKKGCPAYSEELFGPVGSVIRATDEADAIRIANDSIFGLGAAVFTKDSERGRRIAEEELEAGCCFVNSFVRSDPRLPFGGIKESGYGRELEGLGIREFVNQKTVYVA